MRTNPVETTRADGWLRLHVGDARRLDTLLPKGQYLDATITSPPYGPTIDYGHREQIGFGQSYKTFLADMSNVMAVLWDRTRDSGCLWLVVDTFKEARPGGVSRLVPLPFDLVRLAEDTGWVLQDTIIWHKDHTLPWSGPGRLRNSFEYVLFLVKGPGFKYRLDRIRDSSANQDWWHRYPERYSPLGAAPTNVWRFPIPRQGSWGNGTVDHRCPLPDGLVQRIVELTTDTGDVVCDPFAGIGTVPAVAEALGRRSVGVELLPEHVEQFYAAVLPETVARLQPAELRGTKRPVKFARQIAYLRHAKLVRALVRRFTALGIPVAAAVANATVRIPSPAHPHSVGKQRIDIYLNAEADLQKAASDGDELLKRRPLSKFGIEASLKVHHLDSWVSPNTDRWTRVHLVGTRFSRFDNHTQPSVEDPVVLIDIGVNALSRPLSRADSGSSASVDTRHEQSMDR
jgi:DNA modification methylase